MTIPMSAAARLMDEIAGAVALHNYAPLPARTLVIHGAGSALLLNVRADR